MTQPENKSPTLTRHQQRKRRWRSDFSYINAPSGLTTAEAIQYLATRTLDAALRRSRAIPRWKRELLRLAGRELLQGDTGVRYWLLDRNFVGPRDWRCLVRHGSHWLPLSIGLSTCEGQRRCVAHFAAVSESIKAVPFPRKVLVQSNSINRLWGTPEEEAQRDAICKQRYEALLETQERPPPSIKIQWPERPYEKWRYLVLTLVLDIEEDAISDSLAKQVADAFGAAGPVIEVRNVAEHLQRLVEGASLPDTKPPSNFTSWPDYARMLHRHGRFVNLDHEALEALRRTWQEHKE